MDSRRLDFFSGAMGAPEGLSRIMTGEKHVLRIQSESEPQIGLYNGHIHSETGKIRINVVLEKTLESPLDSKEIKLVNLKEINPEYSLEGLMLKLKLQYFGHLIRRADSLEKTGKDTRKD